MNARPSYTYTPAVWRAIPSGAKYDAVRLLALQGFSISEIARRFETTRSTIAGFCHRKKIKIGGTDLENREFVRRPNPFPVEPPVPEATWAPLCAPVALVLLQPHQCKWPVEGGYCGQDRRPAAGGRRSYCETHAAIAFIPATIGESAYKLKLRTNNSRGGFGVSLREVLPLVRAEEHKKVGAE